MARRRRPADAAEAAEQIAAMRRLREFYPELWAAPECPWAETLAALEGGVDDAQE